MTTITIIIGTLILLMILGGFISYVKNGRITDFSSLLCVITTFLIPLWILFTLAIEMNFIIHMLFIFIGVAVDLLAIYLSNSPTIIYTNLPIWIVKISHKELCMKKTSK